MTLKTKIDEHVLKEGRPQKNLTPHQTLGYPTTTTGNQARNELAIIDYKK